MIRFVLEAVAAFVFRLGPIPVWVVLCFVVGRLFIYGVDRISQSIESLKPEVVTVEKERIVYRERKKPEIDTILGGIMCGSDDCIPNSVHTTSLVDNYDQGGIVMGAAVSMDIGWVGGFSERSRRRMNETSTLTSSDMSWAR